MERYIPQKTLRTKDKRKVMKKENHLFRNNKEFNEVVDA